ncbi:hypothetical protein LZ30DRAFT_821649 [Colletotrichum cereale]|nr:hypothetical protein LZ30DRAFT_821649 [Colletotrichum cereale]
MSGFEVAGVVLGSIPLIISALEHYQQGKQVISIWRNYDQERRSLIRNLKTERVRLQNVWERLLIGLVPSNQIERMISEPFGPSWHEEYVQRKIKDRLWTSSAVFEEIMGDMEAAIRDMMRLLHLDPDEMMNQKEASIMAQQFKRASFAFKRSDYKNSLDTIKECITGLESMLEQNIKMEPQRRQRSQGRLIQLIHDVSGSVYRALRSGLSCTCNHDLHLGLVSPSTKAEQDSDDETILQKFAFELAVTYNTDSSKHGKPALWKELCVRTVPPEANYNFISVPKHSGLTHASRPQQYSSVTTNLSYKTTATCIQQPAIASAISSTHSSLSITPAIANALRGIDLCAELSRNQKQVAVDCYGMVSDQTGTKARQFGVYPQPGGENTDTWSVVSLRGVLENPRVFPHMSVPDKLRLASVISSSLLQLHQTPWLPDILTSRDIFFLKKGSDAELKYSDVFIVRKLPESDPKALADDPVTISRCPALLSLGILLLELRLGGTIESFRNQYETPPNDAPRLLFEFLTAQRLLEQRQIGSQRYSSAVKRCLWGEFGRAVLDLGNDDFRQEVYEKVVVLLEHDFMDATGSHSVRTY